ncbi:MAG: hypothetical protein QF915_04725, partial [Candidatus Woesearchaeota archaeon]|nr:hypothetical protein [Candidatus Woesearchaeota archaeon]
IILILALIVLILFTVWGIFAYLGFWLMVLFNIPIILLIALKAHADLHDAERQEVYRDAAIIAGVVTLIIYIFSINIPLLLVTDFMLLTFLIVQAHDGYHWLQHNQETVHHYKRKILRR